MEIFLLAGQSNMAGRGSLASVPTIVDDNIFVYKNGSFINAIEPLHSDKPSAGAGLAMSFAQIVGQKIGKKIGLVPCAVGGTALAEWQCGAPLYTNAVELTKKASDAPNCRIAGILWHQGETDSMNKKHSATYYERFLDMAICLRRDLGAQAPIIIGELGYFLNSLYSFSLINESLKKLAKSLHLCALASAKGLTSIGDNLHFDAVSLREFGKRYAESYLNLTQN